MNQEQQDRYDHSMMKVLMVEFFRESNIPFSMADNPKFQAIFRYLRPTIPAATCSDLLQMNIDDFESFRELDTNPFFTDHASKRASIALKNAGLDSVPNQEAVLDQGTTTFESPLVDSFKEEPLKANVPISETKCSPFLERDIKEEPITDYEGVNSSERKQFEHVKEMKVPKIEEEEEEEEEMFDESHNHMARAPREPIEYGTNSHETLFVGYSSEPSLLNLKGKFIRNDLITFEREPGIVRWPCVVCQERMEPIKVRTITNNDAYFMIYLSVINGLYPLQKGRDLARMQKFVCCVQHLTPLYESAVHHLEITDPVNDITTDNQRIVDAYHVVKNIRDSRFQQKLVFEGSRKHMIPFCNALKKYFAKYRRQNYIKTDQLKELLPLLSNT